MLVAVVVGAYPQSARADSIRGQEWFLSSLDVARAHSYSEGKGVIVGIVDTGVDASHPDLRGNVLSGIDFSDPSRPGGFGNGETDTASHGTAMAGLIAAHGHGASNGSGITGIAPQAKLLPIRDGTGYLDATATQMATGVIWAVDHGATVICIAEAGYNGSASEEHAIQYAESKDVVVVAGVGNVPASKAVAYPAAYPGVLAASDGLNHAYSTGTGTSNSTAIIAGAAALVRARFPQLSAVEVIHRLTATATDKGPKGRDDEYGYGELNLVAALTADVPPLPSATKSPTLSHTPEAVKPPAHRTPWLPLTAALVAFLAVLAVWAAAHRRRS